MSGLDDIQKTLETALQDMFNKVGAFGAEEMKSHLSPESGMDTERLYNGISFATSTAQGRANMDGVKEGDLPEKPASPYVLLIGTQNPYAKYVNYGSLPIGQGSQGSAEPGEGSFREKVLEWAIRKWGDSPEIRDRAYRIIKSIAENGTDAIPFFEPAFGRIREYMHTGAKEFTARVGQSITPKVTIVSAEGVKINTKAGAR